MFIKSLKYNDILIYNNSIIIKKIIKYINHNIYLFIDISYNEKISEKKSSNNNNDNNNNKSFEYHIISNFKIQFKSNNNRNIFSIE